MKLGRDEDIVRHDLFSTKGLLIFTLSMVMLSTVSTVGVTEFSLAMRFNEKAMDRDLNIGI